MNTYDRLAPHYELMYAGSYHAQQEQDIAWLDHVLQIHHVNSVLDSSCGDGIHAIPLARLGYRLTGSDLSRGMLRQARKRCAEAGVFFPLHALDFRRLERQFSPASFDAVLALGHSLVHVLSPQHATQALQQMGCVLKPQGLLLVDLPDFERLKKLPSLSSTLIPHPGGGVTVVISQRQFERDRVQLTLYRLEKRGRRARTHVYTVTLRAWSAQDFERQLQSVGFGVLARQENWGQRGYLYTLQKLT